MLSKGVVIIIAICSAITFLFLVLIISRRCTQSSTPLPTRQPLAHHRSQYLEQLQIFPTTLLHQSTTPRNSTIHLLPTTPQSSNPSSRHHSPSTLTLELQSHSVVSHTTKNSRGVPYGRIKVVLPTPLALAAGRGASTADHWVSAGNAHQQLTNNYNH